MSELKEPASDTLSSEAVVFDQVVRARRSVRGFTDERVPESTLQQIFETASWAPSGTNVQPWQVYVASGEVRDRFREAFLERALNKVAVITDHPGDGKLDDPWRARKRACARALYGAMDIEWEDREGRKRAAMRNYEIFDAPHVAFLGMHERFSTQSACDVGMYAQTLMLAMTAHGVSSCAQGTLRNHPDLVREMFNIPSDIKILFGISFGYEDTSVPANDARTVRADLDETVQFFG